MAAIAMLFRPGIATFDTVDQYGQVLTGRVDDWHPPVMARLWQLVHPLGAAAGPMFVLQAGLYIGGFSLIIAALVRIRRPLAAFAVLAFAISPLMFGWQMVVLKDTQMLGALIAAFALILHYRLSGRKIPPPAAAIGGLLLAYATLVRANAVFATVPLVILILPQPRSLALRGGIAAAAIVSLLALAPFIDRDLFGASKSGVAKTLPLFDLAAIAVAAPGDRSPFTPAEREQISKRHCAKAYFWDPLGDPTACGPITRRLKAQPEAQLYIDLLQSVAAHPLIYGLHRLRHWNSTERWLVASNLPDMAPPDETEPNDLGLGTPRNAFALAWQDLAASEAATPVGWPIVWTCLSLFLLPLAWKERSHPASGLGLGLLGSALALEGSFLFVSIASDFRYHLWPVTASALALILLWNDLRLKRGLQIVCGSALLILVISGFAARISLPSAPEGYEEMINAASG